MLRSSEAKESRACSGRDEGHRWRQASPTPSTARVVEAQEPSERRVRPRLADLALGAVADHNARARIACGALSASDRRIVVRRTRRAPEGVRWRKGSRRTARTYGGPGDRVGVEARELARGEQLSACGGWKAEEEVV